MRDLFFYVPPILSVRHRRHVFSISVRSYSRTGGNALTGDSEKKLRSLLTFRVFTLEYGHVKEGSVTSITR